MRITIINVSKSKQTFVGFSPLRQLKGYTKPLLTAFKSIVNVHSFRWVTVCSSEDWKAYLLTLTDKWLCKKSWNCVPFDVYGFVMFIFIVYLIFACTFYAEGWSFTNYRYSPRPVWDAINDRTQAMEYSYFYAKLLLNMFIFQCW